MLSECELARKEHRRIEMVHFPAVKELSGFDFEAQPAIDSKHIRDLAVSRWIANGENVLRLGPRASGKRILPSRSAARRCSFTAAKAHADKRLDEKLRAAATDIQKLFQHDS